jgi:hypothetical protein
VGTSGTPGEFAPTGDHESPAPALGERLAGRQLQVQLDHVRSDRTGGLETVEEEGIAMPGQQDLDWYSSQSTITHPRPARRAHWHPEPALGALRKLAAADPRLGVPPTLTSYDPLAGPLRSVELKPFAQSSA